MEKIEKARIIERTVCKQKLLAEGLLDAQNAYQQVIHHYKQQMEDGADAGSNEIALNPMMPSLIAKYSQWFMQNSNTSEQALREMTEIAIKDFKSEEERYHEERMKELREKRLLEKKLEQQQKEEGDRQRREEEERAKAELQTKIKRWKSLAEKAKNLFCFMSDEEIQFLHDEERIMFDMEG